MAITKEEAALRTNANIEPEVMALEKKIDDWLISSRCSNAFNCVNVDRRVRAEIERRYTAAGWKVTFHSDQRDGNFWTFE